MRDFKKQKAREMFLESLKLDEEAKKRAEKEIEQIGVVLDTTCEIFTEACGLRVLADDLEDGLISEEELEL